MDVTEQRGRRILMFFPFAPYPLRANGLAMRYWPILRELNRRHELDVLMLRNDVMTDEVVDGVRKCCSRLVTIPHPKSRKATFPARLATRSKALLPWTVPNEWSLVAGSTLRQAVRNATANRSYDAVLSVTGMFSEYLTAISTRRFVIDFIDSPTMMLDRNVHDTSGRSLGRAYEVWKMSRWEARLIRSSDAAIYISDVDAAVIDSSLAPIENRKVVPNGISIDDFSESRAPEVCSPSIGFLGNMGYPPNVEASLWLYEKVFQPLKQEISSLSLVVIGRDPAPEIARLSVDPRVLVTGAVDEIWPLVNAVDVFAFPLLRGAGLKNKVLEAMYCRKAVVTTPLGAEGTGAVDGRELVIARDAAAFRSEIARLFQDVERRERLGAAAREFVSSRFAWDRVLNDFEAALLGATPA
jgi:glycosyltransferase involved in cell wall biosynthesis